MKIAITIQDPAGGNPLKGPTDPRFGRSAGFAVVDTTTGDAVYVDNARGLSLSQGAGLEAARVVLGLGVEAVLTGHVGAKAFLALTKGGVQVFSGTWPSADAALAAYREGRLSPAFWPSVSGRQSSASRSRALRAV